MPDETIKMNGLPNVISIDTEYWGMKYGIKTLPNLADLLSILRERDIRTTFFCMGDLYQKQGWIIDSIAKDGHEIAFHTSSHPQLLRLEVLIEELERAKGFLKEYNIRGFRAPMMFLRREYLRTLAEHGFVYDSSTYADFDSACCLDGVWEIPVTALRFWPQGGLNRFPSDAFHTLIRGEIPVGSSYFLAILGKFTSSLIAALNRQGKPAVIFVHSWQTDPKLAKGESWMSSLPKGLVEYPYLRDLTELIQYLTSRHSFTTMTELVDWVARRDQMNYLDRTSNSA